MGNKLTADTKPCIGEWGRRLIAVLIACVLIFSISACAVKNTGTAEEIKPVTVEREPEPQSLQTANEATAIALSQYIYARLLTEAFMAEDASKMTREELSETVDSILIAWKNAEQSSLTAENLSGRALTMLETPAVKGTSTDGHTKANFLNNTTSTVGFNVVAYAAEAPKKLDPKTWAENLTKQYDTIKGANRYKQLAKQLGTDAKSAYEQMTLAQEIIRNEATSDAAFWDKMTKAAQATKTASKIGLLGVSMVATGGGSVALLEGAGLLVGGVDCIVDVAETGSTIILGDNNQVAVAFGDIKEKLGPVSSLIGLATLNPAGVGKAAKDTTEALVYITDSLVDLFYEDKIVGVKVEGLGLSEQTFRISGQIFEAGKNAALEAAGFLYPETTKAISKLTEFWEDEQDEAMTERIEALVTQMAELEREAGITEEASLESGGGEPSNNLTESVPAGDINIFGRYSVTSHVINSDDEEGTSETSIVTILDLGQGKVQWIQEEEDDDEFEDDDAPIIMTYDASTHKLRYFEEGFAFDLSFTSSKGTVTGSGNMSGSLWGEPIEATLSLTKISD